MEGKENSMIHRLFLMRHSITETFATSDFQRNLTKLGKIKAKNQAIKLELFFKNKDINLGYCFYSSANRAEQTFDIVHKTMELNIATHKTRALYLTGIKELKNIFKTYKKDIENTENILIIAHNFGISDTASVLCGNETYMDTADIVALSIDIDDNWHSLLDYEGSWDIISKL